ncbi:MAG: hypothetical protein ACREX8_05885 [Gammaproteobacteria bacterium]
MRKLITLTLTVLLVGLFAAVVFAAVEAGDDSAAPAGTTEATETTDTTETTETTGTTETTTTPEERGNAAAPQPGVDISGPCDEAEHANDPRCTGAGVPAAGDEGGHDRARVDNSGPGSVNSGHGGDDDSGDDDDSSGRGRGRGGDDD